MTELCSLKETVEKHELLAKKSLGQNFLLDMNITNKIIRSSLQLQRKEDFSKEFVYEIGPGPGGLTRAILNANPKKLTVIDYTATTFCMDKGIPVLLFGMDDPYNIIKAIKGEHIGTIIKEDLI